MTSPYAPRMRPLRDLPPPRRIPRESAELVPPGEIIAESKGAILRRLMQRIWAPGLVLMGLWYLLLTLYVVGASPTFWFLSLIVALAEPGYFRATVLQLGFTSSGLTMAYLFLPLVATALSIALAPVVPRLLAGLQPRRFLTEKQFQDEIATRTTAVLMLPPALVVAVLPLTVVLGLPQPWSGLGAGPLSSWCLALLALPLAWILVRRLVPASRLLGITDVAALQTTARIGPDLAERERAQQQVRAQDRRHLPPSLGTPELGAAATPRGALTALAHIARASLTWVLPAAAGTGWILFGITDFVTVIAGISAMDLTEFSSPLSWQHAVVGLPITAIVVLGVMLAPALAVPLAATQRDQVTDQRTYEDWSHRARVNPWEARVVQLTGLFSAGWALLATLLAMVVLALLQAATAFTWALVVTIALVVVPLLGFAASSGMKQGLRDVLYGPAGDYMRRTSPYALVAPDIGTRAQRAADPAVRAALRKRLQAEGGDHTLEIFDLDAAGERLWVDDSEPGAKDTAVRAADLERGLLPDFGGEGSRLTGGGQEQGAPPRHSIPDSVTGLREPRP